MKINKIALIAGMLVANSAHGVTIKRLDGSVIVSTDKVVMFSGAVNETNTEHFQSQMLNTTGIPGMRVVLIDSPGGNVPDGQEMISMIQAEQALGVKVVCVVMNYAASMAFNFLTYCDIRLARPKARLLFHKIYRTSSEIQWPGTQLTAKKLREMADDIDRDDLPYKTANMKALHMSNKDYDIYADNEQVWTADALLQRKYLDAIVTVEK